MGFSTLALVRRQHLLLGAWIMLIVSLPSPAFHGGSGFFGDPMPVYLMLIVAFAMPQALPVSIAAASFVLTQLFALAGPHGVFKILYRVLALGMLAAWVLPMWESAASTLGMGAPLTQNTTIGWGYYLWACACTAAWIGTLPAKVPSMPAPVHGFPVFLPPKQPHEDEKLGKGSEKLGKGSEKLGKGSEAKKTS